MSKIKRGRPSLRYTVQSFIIKHLQEVDLPVSIDSLRKKISKDMERRLSWNTVQKYLQELVDLGKVEAIPTPHSKKEGKEGLTVYMLKK